MCHFVFDNNSGVSWSIFILFVPVETGRNTLQFTFLWLDDVITVSRRTSQKFVSYSYFIKLNTLSLKIDLVFFVKNLWECENFSHRRLVKEFTYIHTHIRPYRQSHIALRIV